MVQRGVRGGVHLRRPSFQPRRPSFPVKMVVKMAENGGEVVENGVGSRSGRRKAKQNWRGREGNGVESIENGAESKENGVESPKIVSTMRR